MTHPMDVTPVSILVGGKPTLASAAVDFPAPGGGRRLVSLIELIDCWEHDHAMVHRDSVEADPDPIARLIEAEPLKLGRLVFDVPPDTTIAITTRGRLE